MQYVTAKSLTPVTLTSAVAVIRIADLLSSIRQQLNFQNSFQPKPRIPDNTEIVNSAIGESAPAPENVKSAFPGPYSAGVSGGSGCANAVVSEIEGWGVLWSLRGQGKSRMDDLIDTLTYLLTYLLTPSLPPSLFSSNTLSSPSLTLTSSSLFVAPTSSSLFLRHLFEPQG